LLSCHHVLQFSFSEGRRVRRLPHHPVSCDIWPVKEALYYKEHLAAERLQQCYQLAPARVKQYLRAEVDFVLARLRPDDVVLDLGCGYGRTMLSFCGSARFTVGADNSLASLRLAQERLVEEGTCGLLCADAKQLGFASASFDRVVCIQNGISAFHVDPRLLVREAVRVLRPGGMALFSTYSDRFWEDRLDWFERQSAAGLIGDIDRNATRDGVVVCKDGFTARTVHEEEFRKLVAGLDVELEPFEVDGSSLFFLISA
jgi:2-polyprenyl-6-hydroxyphenyl methylase/3-demethylubiquinone-9 3-methyltransferase